MPFGPSYTPQNVQDAFQPMFTNLFYARIQEGGMRLDSFFPPEPMVGENIITRQLDWTANPSQQGFFLQNYRRSMHRRNPLVLSS
jgi:hypothetical protein